MADKPWKVFERKIGAIFGTTRALMKGTNEVKDIGPEDDFPLVLDCKLWKQQNWQITKWFAKLEEVAGDDRWPVLCIREPGKKRAYALVERTRIMNYITQNVAHEFSANDFYHWQAKKFGPIALILTWDKMLKEMREHNSKYVDPISDKAIPMMSMVHGSGLSLTVFRPEDLARIFRIGGLLKNG